MRIRDDSSTNAFPYFFWFFVSGFKWAMQSDASKLLVVPPLEMQLEDVLPTGCHWSFLEIYYCYSVLDFYWPINPNNLWISSLVYNLVIVEITWNNRYPLAADINLCHSVCWWAVVCRAGHYWLKHWCIPGTLICCRLRTDAHNFTAITEVSFLLLKNMFGS